MSYDKQRLLRDADGVPIPQYWDVEESKFKPMGKPAFDGNIELESSEESPIYTQLTGSNVEEPLFENEILPAGGSKTSVASFQGHGSYRLVVRKHGNLNSRYYVDLIGKYNSENFPQNSWVRILEVDGENSEVVNGRGSRGLSYTDILSVL